MFKSMKRGVWAGIFLFLVTLVFFVLALGYDYSDRYGPGPGFFPAWVTGILLILSLIYIYESAKEESSMNEKPMIEWTAFKRVLRVLVALIGYVVLVTFVGFIFTTTVFLFSLLYKEYKWYSSLAISLGTSIFLFFLFEKVLKVTLPGNGFIL